MKYIPLTLSVKNVRLFDSSEDAKKYIDSFMPECAQGEIVKFVKTKKYAILFLKNINDTQKTLFNN